MTKILYYEHPMVVECSASVVSCSQTDADGGFAVVLTKTPIFPEGGGQLTVDGQIGHLCTAAFAPGETVRVMLDVEGRLDHSEQHTGEHILSGLASKLFGANNVGFHMAESYSTIDLDAALTGEQLALIELQANEVVRRDLPVHTEVTDGEDAGKRPLRKRAEKATGEVRIVYVDGGAVDSCTCCGTHLPSTGMVGAIRITDAQSYKGGVRITFVCGGRAARLSIEEHALLSELARQYSTSRTELASAIKKQQDELASVKAESKRKSVLIAERLACELIEGAERAGACRVIVRRLEAQSANDLKLLADELSKRSEAEKIPFAALLFAASADGTDYRLACSAGVKPDMKELVSVVNAATGGKGGGSAVFAQGRSERRLDEETLLQIRDYMLRAMK